MEGKADVPDLPGSLLLLDPFLHPHPAELVPRGCIRQHVHQIQIDIVRLQTFFLLVKIPVDRLRILDQIVRQLGRNADLLPTVIAREDRAERLLAAAVDIRRVEIIHAGFDRCHDFAFRLVNVDPVSFFVEAHASVAEHRHFRSVFQFSVLHMNTPAGFSVLNGFFPLPVSMISCRVIFRLSTVPMRRRAAPCRTRSPAGRSRPP